MGSSGCGCNQRAAGSDERKGKKLEAADTEHSPVPSGGKRDRKQNPRLCTARPVPGGAFTGADPGTAG